MTTYHINIICVDGQLGRLLLGAITLLEAEARTKAVRFLLGPDYCCQLLTIVEAL